MSIKAVLFDIDGTLADSNELHVSAWDEVFRARGIRLSRRAIHDQIGKGADLLVPALVPGADEQEVQALGDEHGAVFKSRYLARVQPFPHAHNLLGRAHHAGMRVVLASSASQDELERYLDLFDARAFVHASTSIDDVRNSKPAPDIFDVALKRAHVAADQALAIGDSPYDVQAAGRCGVATLALRSGGFSDEVLLSAGAAALYNDASDLLADFDRALLTR
ncbi:HAD family hydrolase [Caulobacter sp. S45]|jgi:HAD superfamily hydrolase (TIGR01509 family)|uniref:HAD family hydrolase n=1 Tax=Caulobacter sp. S45 TaxID=1641861 RepID=UPI00131E2E92|nr:HAD family hydrolase [Caulobacter sp. S45]